MSPPKEQRYRLLQSSSGKFDSEESLPITSNNSFPNHFSRSRERYNSFKISTYFSFLTNVLLVSVLIFLIVQQSRSVPQVESRYVDVSPYAGLARQPSFRFPYSTGYGPTEATNHTYADELWEAIDVDRGIVAVNADWAEEHNLPETQVFPWDPSKRMYVVNAYHTLHCLQVIHRFAYEAHHGYPFTRQVEHVMHCLDGMRKDAMCNADDYLLPAPPSRHGSPGPRGQSRICKNWDALTDWAKERNACYKRITDDNVAFEREGHKEIERYFHCEEGSPYWSVMKEYIDSKGGEFKMPESM